MDLLLFKSPWLTTSAVFRTSLIRKIRSKNDDSLNLLHKIITIYRERNSTPANLLKAGFISVYNLRSLLFIKWFSLTFVNNLGKKLNNIKRKANHSIKKSCL